MNITRNVSGLFFVLILTAFSSVLAEEKTPCAETLDPHRLGPKTKEVLSRMEDVLPGNDQVKLALAHGVQRHAIGTSRPERPAMVILALGIPKGEERSVLASFVQAFTGKKESFSFGDAEGDSFTASNEELASITSQEFGLNVIGIGKIENTSVELKPIVTSILEKGKVEETDKVPVDFTHSVAVLFSDLGRDNIVQAFSSKRNTIGFNRQEHDPLQPLLRVEEKAYSAIEDDVLDILEDRISPDFRLWVDYVWIYQGPNIKEGAATLERAMVRINKENFSKGPGISLSEEARSFILRTYIAHYGRRKINRLVDTLIVNPVTNLLATGQINNTDLVHVTLSSDGRGLRFESNQLDLFD